MGPSLLSRRAFLTRLDRMAREGFDHEIVVLFCDLDGFKPVNDRFGHASGDEVLIEVARRVERAVRPDDLVGRLGGDEFVVALPRAGMMLAEDIATRIRTALTEPIIVDDEIIEIDVSIGTSVTTDQSTAVQFLAAADDAMYAVKRSRRRDETVPR